MSAPEVETVLAWHEALNAGDVERLVALSHPQIELGGPRGPARGLEVLRAWVGRANVTLVPARLFGRDATVVAEEAATWRDAASGEKTGGATVATVFLVEDDLVAGVFRHDALEEALKAAGLDRSHEI